MRNNRGAIVKRISQSGAVTVVLKQSERPCRYSFPFSTFFARLEQSTVLTPDFVGRSLFLVLLAAFVYDSGFHSATTAETISGCCSLFSPFFLLTLLIHSWKLFRKVSFRFISLLELPIASATLLTVDSIFCMKFFFFDFESIQRVASF
ncbi:unnamed protein product [Hymenolepis diminuta]|uniref:Uncharacterized protein n=1 Tax=Hymenolepis diminuta TaxID=6216 RepID=A0A564Y7H7_HYMDI|nr:unnamed protein product [Hymenolepis diminuta]VUZ43232.1 unnamed protein product [Hymenolepis diminuta]VUZ45397.1 unnamed protein product [Hymenolepis diminuta]